MTFQMTIMRRKDGYNKKENRIEGEEQKKEKKEDKGNRRIRKRRDEKKCSRRKIK